MDELMKEFLAARRFALLGASRDPAKYGNVIPRQMLGHGYEVIPVNPRESAIEGIPCVPRVTDVSGGAPYVDVVLPAPVTLNLVPDLAAAGCRVAWLQPGAESADLVAALEGAGIAVIHGGPCIMVAVRTLASPA